MLKHDINNMECQHFLNIFINILNKHALVNQKYLRAKEGRFMTKNFHKVIMKRSRLRNKFLNDRTEMSQKEYKKQRTFSVNLLKKAKKEHFANFDVNSTLNNKKFWQIVKLFSQIKLKLKQVSNQLKITK